MQAKTQPDKESYFPKMQKNKKTIDIAMELHLQSTTVIFMFLKNWKKEFINKKTLFFL